jgi:hypothetical protein
MVLVWMKLIVVLFLLKLKMRIFFSPIPVFDFDEKFDTTGEDLLICLEEVLAKLKDEFN